MFLSSGPVKHLASFNRLGYIHIATTKNRFSDKTFETLLLFESKLHYTFYWQLEVFLCFFVTGLAISAVEPAIHFQVWGRIKALKEYSIPRIKLQSHQAHPPCTNMTYMQHGKNTKYKHKHKWVHAQWNWPSETKPNPENCKNRSSKCRSNWQNRIFLSLEETVQCNVNDKMFRYFS